VPEAIFYHNPESPMSLQMQIRQKLVDGVKRVLKDAPGAA
jgi:hypothetical protein